MDASLTWKMLVSSIILISGADSCSTTVYNRTITEVLEPNSRSPWLVLIVDQSKKEFPMISGISYGSLIKDNLVLTAASKITRFYPNQLEVVLNWRSTDKITYDSRVVTFFFYSPSLDIDQVKPSDWMILVLVEPFELYDKIGIIPLADTSHQWDSEDCLIYRLIPMEAEYEVESRVIREEGFLHQEYPVSISQGSSGIYKKERVKLHKESDCIIESCGVLGDDKSIIKNISFVGSPIVCKLVDQDQYVQVGFSNYVSRWNISLIKASDDKDVSEYDEDNFVELVKDFEEVILPLLPKD